MLQDAQGLVITTNSLEAVGSINHFMEQALGYGKQAESAILQAITADPTCAIAHAYAAAYYLSLESFEGRQQAIAAVQKAQQYRVRGTRREQLYIDAIAAWSKGNIPQAIAKQEAIVDQFPTDLIALQQAQYHYFYQGNKAGLLNVAEKAFPKNQGKPYIYGMLAFGLEQCDRHEEAEMLGRQALIMNRNDPWAQHAVAHVMEAQGRVVEGIAWMEHFTDTWENCSSMLYTHNWWHLALYYLKQENYQRVLRLYDHRVWGNARKTLPKDQVGAISLLLRLELNGVAVGEHRWRELAAYVHDRIYDRALPFQDLHYIYALARSGERLLVREMLSSMAVYTTGLPLEQQIIWREVTLPAAKALLAHAIGNWPQATQLQSVLPKLWMVGGSLTQRDLFEQVYQNALRHQTSPFNPLMGDRLRSRNHLDLAYQAS
jgi:tetratricopeptide (TPR) repeat protein